MGVSKGDTEGFGLWLIFWICKVCLGIVSYIEIIWALWICRVSLGIM